MLMGGAIGLPIPEDLPLILAGIAAHLGKGQVVVIFLVCYTSILIGDSIIYFAGRKFGPKIFGTKWFKKKIPPNRIRRIRLNLEKRSLLMIFIARHLFYMRTVTFLTCGAVKMRVGRFLIADAIAALISVPLMMSIGYLASEHYEEVTKNLRNAAIIIPPVILIAYLVWRWGKKTSQTEEISEKPQVKSNKTRKAEVSTHKDLLQ